MRRGFLKDKTIKTGVTSSSTPNEKGANESSAISKATTATQSAKESSAVPSTQKRSLPTYDLDGPQPPPDPKIWSLVQFMKEGISPLVERMTVMTIPARTADDGSPYKDPDGHVEFISHADWSIPPQFVTPGAIKPIPKTPQVNYEIKTAPGMGQGMFSTRDIEPYELVFAERPILITHNKRQRVYIAPPPGGKPGPVSPKIQGIMYEHEVAFRNAWESQLENSLSRMDVEDRNTFMGLSGTFQPGYGPLATKVQANAYGLWGFDDSLQYGITSQEDLRKSNMHSAVGKHGSRINNSCRPNIVQLFSMRSLCLTFVALRAIKKGEELFYCYTHPFEPVVIRQQVFAAYCFECKCLACTYATPQSEQFRAQAYRITDALRTAKDQWIKRPDILAIEKQALKHANDHKQKLLQEGLDTMTVDAIINEILEKVNEKKGNISEAVRYRNEKDRLSKYSMMLYD